MSMKKSVTRCVSAMLVFVMVFSMFFSVLPTDAFAAPGETGTVKKVLSFPGYSNITATGGKKMSIGANQGIYIYGSNNEIAYCVDHGKAAGNYIQETSETLIPRYADQLKAAIGYGYSYKKGTFLGKSLAEAGVSQEAAFVATQVLVWEICDGFRDGFGGGADFWTNDGRTYDGLLGIGKAGVANAYSMLLTALAQHELGDLAFAPKGFYPTAEEALAKALRPEISKAIESGIDYTTPQILAGQYLKDYTRLRIYYGMNDEAVYDLIDGKMTIDSGTMSPLYGVSTSQGKTALNIGIINRAFKKTSSPTKIDDDGTTIGADLTPIILKIWRSRENTPVVTGVLSWFVPKLDSSGTEDDSKAQRRIQFTPDSHLPQSILWAAIVSDAIPTGEVTKFWDDGEYAEEYRPDSVTFKVYRESDDSLVGTYELGLTPEGTPIEGTEVSVDGNRWIYKINGLDMSQGYYIVEDDIDLGTIEDPTILGYEAEYDHETLTVTNKMLTTTPIPEPPVKVYEPPNDVPPSWDFPTLSVTIEKDDKEGGFDNNVHTPRGNATLAAYFETVVNNSKGTSSSHFEWTPHNGEYAVTTGITPWSSTDDADSGGIMATDSDCENNFATYYRYDYSATIYVYERVEPEGYLTEAQSGTGNGVRGPYTVTLTAEARRSVEDEHEPPEGGGPDDEPVHVETILTPWEYTYTVNSSATGSDSSSTAQVDYPVAYPVFVNEVKKGQFQLVKTYDEDLDQWTDINAVSGLETYIPNSLWTLQLIDGIDPSDGGPNSMDNVLEWGGSENHPYVRVIPIGTGDPRYSVWGNSYYVPTNGTGVAADSNNPIRTNEYGQLYVYELPYGYYKLTELRNDANEGYVLETVYFYITKDFDVEGGGDSHPSQDVNDEVIENELLVVKVDSETGKTVPYAGVAFRVKYLGYTHSNPGANPLLEDLGTVGTYNGKPIYANAHSGTYAKNGRSVDDGYQYVFYTDATGRVKLPYALEYGVWQLEEITAPYGYYIGDYTTGVAMTVAGNKGFDETVAIFDAGGNKIQYTENAEIIFNYYPFEVHDQDKGQIVVQLVEMTNNATKGKIEVKKVGERLVGFTESNSQYGTLTTPVYEMKPLAGAVFEIIAATDVTLHDGYTEPRLYDRLNRQIEPELIAFTHQLWPDAYQTRYAKLVDGTEAYITTERFTDNDYIANGNTHNNPSMMNMVSATLLSALQNGVVYELVYDVIEVEPKSRIGIVTTYRVEIGLEYAAGGWNYSYFDVSRETKADDYYYTLDNTLPVITQNGQSFSLNDYVGGETFTLPDGSSIDILEVTDVFQNEMGVSAKLALPEYFEDLVPDLQTVLAYDYLTETDGLLDIQLTDIEAEYDITNPIGGFHCYQSIVDPGMFVFAINDEGVQQWHYASAAEPETEDVYVNRPDTTVQEATGWTFSVETVHHTGSEVNYFIDFDGEVFILRKGGITMYAVINDLGEVEWIDKEQLIRGTLTQWRRDTLIPTQPGFELFIDNIDFGYTAYSELEQLWAVIVEDMETGELRWARIDDFQETFLTRTATARFNLNESKYSTDGFTVTWGEFVFNSAADHAGEFAIATMYNPSTVEAVLNDSVGCETSFSPDMHTMTVKVVQPERQAWYEMADGIQVGITYLGGYTKTIIDVPHDGLMPVIKYNGAAFDYSSQLNPGFLRQTVDMGNGNYVETNYDQFGQKYVIHIVSNSTDKNGPFTVDYPSGHKGYSIVVYDPVAGAYRGQTTLTDIARTLVYQSGAVVETLVTNADGIAYSSPLHLGTYYVREVDVGYGFVTSNESYQVDLVYAGQYIPLVWGAATVENEALNVTIDISKSFQEAYGSNEYVYKAGAVFGVYNKDSISATATPTDAGAISKSTATPESLLSIIHIGDDGFATTTIKLPFMNDYYIVELDTLDGFTLSDVKYLFRVDETTVEENLDFTFDHDGISGQINQTDLFETTIVIETLYQVPAKWISVNGDRLYSDVDVAETVMGAALVSNEVILDRTVTTIRAKDSGATVIIFENGATLTINVFSDGYTAEFTQPTEADCILSINKGNVLPSYIVQENFGGATKLTYNPTVAYTGYTVYLTDSYRAPTTVMTTEDDVRLHLVFDKASGARTAVLTYPEEIDLPEIAPFQTWLSTNEENKTVTVSMAELLSKGMTDYEYKVILRFIHAVMEGKNLSLVVENDTPLTASDFITKAGIVAKYDDVKVANSDITFIDTEIEDINNAIAAMYLAQDEEDVQVFPLTATTTDENGNSIGIAIEVELKGSEDAETTLTGDELVETEIFFPVYGESIFFTIAPASFEITTAGNACTYDSGLRNDAITVSYTLGADAETTISHTNKVFTVSAENNLSSVKANLNHDSTMAVITVETGTVASAYHGINPVVLSGGFAINPGETLTILTSEGTLYTATLDQNGVFILHGEAIISGVLAEGSAAPSATADGMTYYDTTRLITDTVIEFSESLTYTRSSKNVSSLAVKVNSKAENHMTDNQEGGTSTGRPNDIKNDIISIEFEKVDMEGRPLAGAIIAAFDSTGTEVFRGTTNVNGIAVWSKVKPGVYTYREIEAPTGYELDYSVYTLIVYEDGTISGNRTLYNKKIEVLPPPPEPPKPPVNPPEIEEPGPEYVTISKTDVTDGEPVAGATITVWNKKTGRQIYSGTTNSNGKIIFLKPEPGVYVFREVVAPEGYILNTEEFEFTIDSVGNVKGTTHITNERKPEKPVNPGDPDIPDEPNEPGTPDEPWQITISKIDATDHSPVPGAEITVWDEYGSEVFRGITDVYGEMTFPLLQPGKYTYRETSAPEGYDIWEETFEFTLHPNGVATGKFRFKDIRTGTVVISKIDIIDSTEIPGAEITVTDEDGNVVFKQVSDEYGKIYFYPPAPGTYNFYESYTPDGYYLNEESFTFTVDEDGNITSGITYLENVPVGTVVIKKTDVSDGKELPDAEITIWNADGVEVFRGFTDERGRVYFVSDDWGAGTYTFRETIAPDGYVLNEEIFTFSIDEDGVITGATKITNEKETTDIPKTGLTDWATYLIIAIAVLVIFGSLVGACLMINRQKNRRGKHI